MATKPTAVTLWANTGLALKLTPTSQQQNYGWSTSNNLTTGVPEKPTLQHQNGWQYNVNLWKEYFDQQIDENAHNLVKTGSIVIWPSPVIPSDWRLCDGQILTSAQFPALETVLKGGGTSPWDTAINPTTGLNYVSPGIGNFRVPDLRGSFVRGVGTSAKTGGGSARSIAMGNYYTDTTAVNGLTVSTSVVGSDLRPTADHVHDYVHNHLVSTSFRLTGQAIGSVNGYSLAQSQGYTPTGSTAYLQEVFATTDAGSAFSQVAFISSPNNESTDLYTRWPVDGSAAPKPNTAATTQTSVIGASAVTDVTGDTDTSGRSFGINYIIKT